MNGEPELRMELRLRWQYQWKVWLDSNKVLGDGGTENSHLRVGHQREGLLGLPLLFYMLVGPLRLYMSSFGGILLSHLSFLCCASLLLCSLPLGITPAVKDMEGL